MGPLCDENEGVHPGAVSFCYFSCYTTFSSLANNCKRNLWHLRSTGLQNDVKLNYYRVQLALLHHLRKISVRLIKISCKNY